MPDPTEFFRSLIRETVLETLAAQAASQQQQDQTVTAMTEGEAAKRLGLTPDQLRSERRLGRITFARCGRKIRYSGDDLTGYVKRHRA